MYSSNFVVAIVVGGQIAHEDKGGVATIPFNSEYSIRLRNKNNRRAVALVSIDGDNVSGGGIIVEANSFVDLERSTDKAVKFKFVSSESGEAIDFGKNNKTDGSNGVIKVDWKLEKIPEPVLPLHYYQPAYYGTPEYYKGGQHTNSSRPRGIISPQGFNASKTLEGCTVEGGRSSQSFRTQHIDLESTSVTIILTLRGYNPTAEVATGKFCTKCGNKVAQSNNFCSRCGEPVRRTRNV